MTDKIDTTGLENTDFLVMSELWYEPATAKELKDGKISNPSTHLVKLEKLGFVKKDKWDADGLHYKLNKAKLIKAGILKKEKHGYSFYMGTYKHLFTLGLDSPTEKGFASLFRGLDKTKERDYELWKKLIKLIVDGLNHYFIETEEGFLTEAESIKKKKELMAEKSKEY